MAAVSVLLGFPFIKQAVAAVQILDMILKAVINPCVIRQSAYPLSDLSGKNKKSPLASRCDWEARGLIFGLSCGMMVVIYFLV
jgi:hypothetical protein